MSYNGSGTFQINSTGQPVVTGTVISSTAFNALTADLATGLSTAITKDGQTTTTARVPFAQGVSSTLVTDATSATTGSIITAGGISTQKALWVGTTSRLVGNVQADALVAIGTTSVASPQSGRSMLQISNTGMIDSYNTVSQIRMCANEYINSSNSPTYITTNFATQYAQSAGAHSWSYAASGTAGTAISYTTAMTLDTSGRLGIGMTPNNVLDITQNQNAGSVVKILNNNASGGAEAYFNASNGTYDGHFGVRGTGATAYGALVANMAYIYSGTQVQGIGFIADNGPIVFASGGHVEKARFGTDGSFLVGTTTNGGWTANFIAEFRTTGNGVSCYYTGSSTNATIISRIDSTNAKFMALNYAGSDVGTITTNGSTTAYNTSSDYRLKENVQPMTSGLATIAALKPVTYDWIASGSAGEGFIAHELQAVIPEAVHGEKDAVNEDGSINAQGVDFGKIVPHLVAAIQELTTRLAALETK